ncbi:MAG: hypothetical protein GEU91_09405 [Rhizobiales bacterium]|nr:hypothetical protein [Hyphomicrobiales bacterium]
MSKRIFLTAGSALTIALGAFHTSLAQSELPPRPPTSVNWDDDWRNDVTVLAIAPDGTWGAATEPSMGRAIKNAIDHCKSKYQRKIGCGHRFTTIRGGWSLAFRCGKENIIAAERTLAGTERTALRREHELRTQYVPDMPACVRTVTVDPHGAVVAQELPQHEQAVALQPSVSAKRIR